MRDTSFSRVYGAGKDGLSKLLTPRSLKPIEPVVDNVQHYGGCPKVAGQSKSCECERIRKELEARVDSSKPVVQGMPPMSRTQRRALKQWNASEARRRRRAERKDK